ncbi:putative molybdenum ABC transporter, solute-binding protein [Methanococcus vannielii SB]|uniref:Molybdenum ABC transporter, solute-binding protein n=1 Tax=Methanococcus vannielii (strain ATCC 35089 / DSM 1224 / JCM 13029 / OCM 148 / SB) TaxID=406327 RepID=A6UNY8_METVS|nr:extracellular solute-binding protein [Methanococcus vannielii]ABR54210.1 putative molybdenum ABC transporter, solute-binding protein [Methanococcus vannielii SB]
MKSKFWALVIGLVAVTVLFSGCTTNNPSNNKDILVVYSCGGPTEAVSEVNSEFEKEYGVEIRFTGAAAGTLRKSLEAGAYADVFLPRSVMHSEVLEKAGLMNPDYKVYMFTDWVIVTPKGNPKEISTMEDLLRNDVKVYTNTKSTIPAKNAMAPKAELIDKIYEKTSKDHDCYRKMMMDVVNSNTDAALVERRLTTLNGVAGNVEVIDLPRETMAPQIGIFSVGVMSYSKQKELAYKYQEFLLSEKAQNILQKHGFITLNSKEGQYIFENYYPQYLSLNN